MINVYVNFYSFLINTNLVEKMSHSAIIATAAFSLGVGIMYVYNLKKGQGQQNRQGDTCLAPCTCGEQSTSCERHDVQLLNEISKVVTKSETLVDLGISLGVKTSVIESIQEDYKGSINNTAFKLLQKWYQESDGLRSKSKDLATLKECLKKTGLGGQVKDIVERHFNQ